MSDQAILVPIDDGPNPHSMFKALSLLALDTVAGPLFFIVEGAAIFCPIPELQESRRFLYEEHTCPTNFIDIEAICFKGDMDPHGVFRHVRSVWMPAEYADDGADHDGMLLRLFPELAVESTEAELLPNKNDSPETVVNRWGKKPDAPSYG
jgi:hypothetical protein